MDVNASGSILEVNLAVRAAGQVNICCRFRARGRQLCNEPAVGRADARNSQGSGEAGRDWSATSPTRLRIRRLVGLPAAGGCQRKGKRQHYEGAIVWPVRRVSTCATLFHVSLILDRWATDCAHPSGLRLAGRGLLRPAYYEEQSETQEPQTVCFHRSHSRKVLGPGKLLGLDGRTGRHWPIS
jgi:hypothetical protein